MTTAALPTEAAAPLTLDLVVSRFTEDLAWLPRLPLHVFSRIFVYNKGDDDFEMPCEVKHFEVIKLPNVGKCDHSFLYHIMTRYYDLATSTVFLSGVCHQNEKWFNAMVTVLLASATHSSAFVTHEMSPNVRDAMFMLNFTTYESKDMKNREKLGTNALQPSVYRPFGIWYHKMFGDVQIKHVAYFGIFAASREHIHQRSIDSYVELYTCVNTHPNPEVGHYLERSWLAVFHPVPSQCICPLPENKFVIVNSEDNNITFDMLEKVMRSR